MERRNFIKRALAVMAAGPMVATATANELAPIRISQHDYLVIDDFCELYPVIDEFRANDRAGKTKPPFHFICEGERWVIYQESPDSLRITRLRDPMPVARTPEEKREALRQLARDVQAQPGMSLARAPLIGMKR